MAHCWHHAVSSARRFGGDPQDFIALHEWFDESKKIVAGPQHRALRHHAEGIWMVQTVFGQLLTLSNGKTVPLRVVAERHVIEDLGCIPSFADWARLIRPAPWILRGHPLDGPETESPDDGSKADR